MANTPLILDFRDEIETSEIRRKTSLQLYDRMLNNYCVNPDFVNFVNGRMMQYGYPPPMVPVAYSNDFRMPLHQPYPRMF